MYYQQQRSRIKIYIDYYLPLALQPIFLTGYFMGEIEYTLSTSSIHKIILYIDSNKLGQCLMIIKSDKVKYIKK